MAESSIAPGYLTKDEALALLGRSEKTLDRLVAGEEPPVRSKQVPRPGLKPERIYLAADLEKQKELRTRRKVPSAAVATLPKADAIVRELVALRAFFEQHTTEQTEVLPPAEKPWISIAEAAECSGLGAGYLKLQIKKRQIVGRRGGKHGAWVVHRKSLEAFEGGV